MKFFRLFIAAIISFFILSCSGLNLDRKTGSISIRLPEENSETRDISASEKHNLSYTVSVIDSEGNTVDQKDGTPGAEIVFSELQVGAYIVHCRCYANIDGKQHVYAQAKDTVEILADKVAELTLTLKIENEFLPKEPEKDAEKVPEVTEGEEKQETEKDKEVIEGEGDKGQITTPEVDPDDDPLKDKEIVHEDPKIEETVPDYIKKFEGAETVACTTWEDLADKINNLGTSQSIVCSLSGTYDATSQIIIKFGRKVLLTASADTTINAKCTGGDLFAISSGVLIVAGTKDANITFTGEMPNSIFNVNGSNAELTVIDNVDIKDFNCTNQYAGGAVYVAQGVCSINGGVTFTNCKATKSNGGAINAVGGQLYVTGETLENPVIFNNCSANKDGGAIYINVSEHKDGYFMQLSDIIFGSEEGKENICGTDYYSRDIYINSIDTVPVYLTGNFRSIDSKVEIFAASYFILGSDTETTADLNITFDSNFFDEAISNDMQIIFTDEAYEEALLNHIRVRPLSSPDWKRINETGHVIND